MTQLCFVVTCMGRLSFLKQTLGALCAQADCACVVVDYSCPERAGDWVEANYPQARVVRCPGQTVFNQPAARNAGARVADAPWLCFIDADILIDPGFSRTLLPLLLPGHYYRADTTGEGLLGTWICPRADFERVGGCDEVMQNWGEDDNDLCDALAFAGLRQEHFPPTLIRHLPHQDEMRSQFHAIHNLTLSLAVNRVYRLFKWDLARLMGTPLALDQRRQLYQGVLQRVQSVFQTGKAEMIDVQFAYFTVPGKWYLERQLIYKVRLDRGD
jgi:glycosyltransferase involved in cell wall biosynthesis